MSQSTTTLLPLPADLVERNRRAAVDTVDGEALLAEIARKIAASLEGETA